MSSVGLPQVESWVYRSGDCQSFKRFVHSKIYLDAIVTFVVSEVYRYPKGNVMYTGCMQF